MKSHYQRCKFCGEKVNLNEEGTQYADGSAAHEGCDDAETFARENAADIEEVAQ